MYVNTLAWADENQLKCEKVRILSEMSEINSKWNIFNLYEWTHFKSVVLFWQRPGATPKKRWVDCLDSDFSIIKIKNWRSMAKRRTAWLDLLKKVKAHNGCWASYDDDENFNFWLHFSIDCYWYLVYSFHILHF